MLLGRGFQWVRDANAARAPSGLLGVPSGAGGGRHGMRMRPNAAVAPDDDCAKVAFGRCDQLPAGEEPV